MGQKWIGHCILITIFLGCTADEAKLVTPYSPQNDTTPYQNVFNLEFVWQISGWSECEMQHSPTCCSICLKERNVYCAREIDAVWVPARFCSGLERPKQVQTCDLCPQDCVLTKWSGWSECTGSCTNRKRFRTRQILVTAFSGGRPCNSTIEVESCVKDDLCSVQDKPRFRWKIGEWTSCRPSSVMKSRTTGIRVREVSCTKKHGKVVKKRFCRKALKGEKPLDYEPCILPMDCQVSKWTTWSPCSQTCYHSQTGGFGQQTRTRKILQMPSNSGIGCPLLQDIQSCKNQSLERCPRHEWHYSEWSSCRLMDPSHLCGPGTQVRAVYCTVEADVQRKRIPEQECLEVNGVVPLKPTKQRACEVSCPQNCQVGEWGNWSPCSMSCGKGGVQSRTRPTLVPDMYGGKDCPALVQTKECEQVECQWWFIGAWGKCYLSPGYTDCGPGEMTRVVYCQSAKDEMINSRYCAESEKPVMSETCTVPCPNDCVVSGWSAWSDCSKTCGVKGGTQSRTRRILAYGNNNSVCVRPDQLLETRPCNQISCSMYTWQVSAWGKCESNLTATSIELYRFLGILTDNNGVQKRKVFCKTDTGEISPGALCDQDSKPVNEQICTLPVPQDCVVSAWSAWTSCSKTCGESGQQMRVQLILIRSKNGGNPCPAQGNENGEIHEERFCDKQPSCPNYKWNVNRGWSVCYVPKTGCGRGYRTRKLVCRDRRRKADQALCLENDGEPPANQEKCFVPCAGDCELSPWSDFGPCSQSCGTNPGTRVRARKLANLDHFDNTSMACPHIKQSDLEQSILCGQGECPKFSWELGEWGSCILNSDDATCGRGTQWRAYLCKKNSLQYVPRNHCGHDIGIPVTYMPCDIPCPEDCQISRWSAWSKCSAICGEGMMKRTREVVKGPVNNGRPCTHLEETTLCTARPCENFMWTVTKWGNCNVNYNFTCGKGHQERRVTCPAGERLEHECEARYPKPLAKQDCVIPCVGNCVMSPWSSFGSCECKDANLTAGTKSRSREVIREPSPIGDPCGKVKDEQPCSCYNYTLVAGDWTTCQPYNKSECGTGSQLRPVICQRDDGLAVPLHNCPKISFRTSMSCHIHCPIDCKVGQHDLWSPCLECAKNYQTRSRPIIVDPNRYGRRCPRKDQLSQNRTCNFEPCNLYTYNWYRGPWSECNIEGDGCGFGERHRVVECRRSDDAIVKNLHCLLKDMKHRSNFDMTALDLDTTQPCGNPCPMDCQTTPWSSFGPCYRNCSSYSAHGFKVRTRAIVKPAEKGGQPCPTDLVDISQCGGNEMSCPSFQWIVNDWPGASSRGVFCVSQGGVRVHGGCLESRIPLARRDCSLPCPNFAECSTLSGSCECKPGFEGDGEACFPVQGCQTNEHCPVNQSYCDQHQAECICENGKLPYRGLTCNYTWAMQSDRNTEPENVEDLVWICLGVSIVLALMLIILASVYFWRRNKQKRGELAIHRMVSNNLEIPKKVTNEYVPIHTLIRNKNAEAAEMNITENPLVRSYMQPSYKIRPRPGVSSSNFHLPVNTDDLDDEVFTDNPAEIFMDPRHNLEDDVFMDSSLESRKSNSPPLTFMGSDSSKAKSSVSNHHARIGSDSSKGTDIYSSLRKAKKVAPPVLPTRGSDSSAGPPACTLGRKRFVLSSSEREDMEAMENAKPGSQSEIIPDLSDSGSFEDPLEPSDLGESYLQFVKKRTPNQPCTSAEVSPLKCSTPDKGKGYFMKGKGRCPAPPSSPAVVDSDMNLSTILQTPDSSYFFMNDSSTG
ncbi:thrombospondin type-1 domain-containing protein 7B-like isoform X2 [Lineus longissimus]|uniref:thrombospondin type-1 domain-containing protein 7B-like isoform X2 n=1 Tax=Lineus longissimus TaxID=88925 RepID=UPI00315D8704